MPSRKVHNRSARTLGISTRLADRINREIDEPWKWLGYQHRRERHDLPYAVKNSLKYPDSRAAFLTHMLHYFLDQGASSDATVRRIVKVLEVLG